MRKIILTLILLTIFFITHAGWKAELVYDIYRPMGWSLSKTEWTPFNLSIFPVNLVSFNTKNYGIRLIFSLYYGNETVCGITSGISQLSGKHYGISATALYSASGINYGIAISPINLAIENRGIQAGMINYILSFGETVNFLQIGLFNYAENGFQIGLLNHNPNALIPWMPLFNYAPLDIYKAAENNR